MNFYSGDYRRTNPRFAPENLKANMALVELAKQWAQRKVATPAQVSLAWLLAQKPFIVPIPGTTNANHLTENLGATQVKFSSDELQQLNKEASAIVIKGARLRGDGLLQMSGVEAPLKT